MTLRADSPQMVYDEALYLLNTTTGATYTMVGKHRKVFVETATGEADLTITLPAADEFAGQNISIHLQVLGDNETVDVDDPAGVTMGVQMTTAGGYCVVYSDGHKWIPIASSADGAGNVADDRA